MCQPGLTCAEGIANGGKGFPEKKKQHATNRGLEPRGPPSRGQKGWLQPNFWCFMDGFCVDWTKEPPRTASSPTRSEIAQSKLSTPRPRRSFSRGSGEATIRFAASWS